MSSIPRGDLFPLRFPEEELHRDGPTSSGLFSHLTPTGDQNFLSNDRFESLGRGRCLQTLACAVEIPGEVAPFLYGDSLTGGS